MLTVVSAHSWLPIFMILLLANSPYLQESTPLTLQGLTLGFHIESWQSGAFDFTELGLFRSGHGVGAKPLMQRNCLSSDGDKVSMCIVSLEAIKECSIDTDKGLLSAHWADIDEVQWFSSVVIEKPYMSVAYSSLRTRKFVEYSFSSI